MRPFARSLRRAICASSALSMIAFTPAAHAEEGASAAGDEDIIVTARRRDERLIDVPIAVTALSADTLAKAGALDITDVANMTPNTTLENSRGTNSTLTAFIRGVGQQDPVPGFEAGIGLYLDDVYIDAKYKRFIAGNPPADVSNVRTFQNTPKWTVNGSIAAGLPAMGGNVDVSTGLTYRSLTHQFEVPIPALDQPGYVLWDASLVWTADSGAYSIGLHGKNLTDKHYITSGYNYQNAAGGSTLGQEGVLTAFYGNPRQIFVMGTVRF